MKRWPKNIFLASSIFWPVSMSADQAWKYVYFPESQIRLAIPSEWYARNESNNGCGVLLATKEPLRANESMFETGIQIVTSLEKAYRREFQSTEEAFTVLSKSTEDVGRGRVLGELYHLKTSVGDFQVFMLKSSVQGKNNFGTAILKRGTGTMRITFESPPDQWEAMRPIMERIIQSITFKSTESSGEDVVYSIHEGRERESYKGHAPGLDLELLGVFEKLRPGMSLREYQKIVGWKTYIFKTLKGQYLQINITPGWISTVPISGKRYEAVDIYGVYDGPFVKELFAVTVRNKKVIALKKLDRSAPKNIDRTDWERSLAGSCLNDDIVWDKIKSWVSQKERVLKSFELAKTVPVGTDEQDYLTMAGGFGVQCVPDTFRAVPGVYMITGPDMTKSRQFQTLYVYGYPVGGKLNIIGAVKVSDGRVSEIMPKETTIDIQ